MHDSRWTRYGDFTRGRVPYHSQEERFWPKVDKTPTCWLWIGAIGSGGYGNFYISNVGRKIRTTLAHHWAYEQLIGPVPEGLDLDHLCRNRACVNPAHLEPVTRSTNLRRGVGTAGRTECPQGHPYDEANTYHDPLTGWRQCRQCRAARDAAR